MRIWRVLLLGGVVAVACARPRTHGPSPIDARWSTTIDSAQRLAADSQFDAADSLLTAFARESPTSTGAHESLFWHGVFLLEPRNRNGNAHDAAMAFDSYLATAGGLPHRAEAEALQRASRVIDSLSQQRSMDSVPAVHLVVSDDSLKASAREQEMAKTVKQLQDSLNKTTAELDRIKKRLSTGKP